MIRNTLALAALSIFSLSTAARADFDFSMGYFQEVFPLQGRPSCNSARTTTVQAYSILNAKSCVDHTSFIKTANGGRVRVIFASDQQKDRPHYGAFFREVNCKTMEERHKNLWAFTTADMSSAAVKYKYAGWKKYGSTWVSRTRGGWSEWSPIENMSGEHKWICKQNK